jgi:Uri superfamily endonuclease
VSGVYALFIHVPFALKIPIGALGVLDFSPGYYCYIGSALGGLKQRVGRHLRESKTARWHIDYLLSRSRVVDVVAAATAEAKECPIARRMSERFAVIERFGSSDCGCAGHLFYHPELGELMRGLLEAMREEGLRPLGMMR